MVKVLMVCLGNICRSPMAEGILKKKIEQNKLDATQRVYQIYLSDKKAWEEKRSKIIGADNTPETIKFYEREIKYLENSLNEEIERSRIERTELAESIFD